MDDSLLPGARRACTAAALAFVLTSAATAPQARADGIDLIDSAVDQLLAATPDPASGEDGLAALHAGVQDWIGSDLGKQIDGVINTALGSYAIGNGSPGTAAHPDGGAAGWLLGDGGDGWTPPQAGGAPSTATGVAGGDGGDGGLFGNGGHGGDGGPGVGADGLPALGGAGGNAGLFGQHGANGHAAVPIAPVDPAHPPALEVNGGSLTDASGRVITLHGVNEVYKDPPFTPAGQGFGDDDAAFLAANGFNSVRVGVVWSEVEPQPGVFNDAYLASIARTVQILHNHGIVSVLDMHQDQYGAAFGSSAGAPAWATPHSDLPNPDLGFPLTYLFNPAENYAWGQFWSNADASNGVGLENNYALMWEHVAAYFKGNPGIGGYEIMNEPWPGYSWLLTVLGDPAFAVRDLTPFTNQVDAAIRAVDPSTPVFFEPNDLFSDFAPVRMGAVDDPNTVFSFHSYCIPTAVLASVSAGCDAYDAYLMDEASAYTQAHHIPGVMSEFGNNLNTTTFQLNLEAADKAQFGWLFWDYNSSLMVPDPAEPPTGDNVNTAVVETLAAPYPQAIAGTPGTWSFNDGVFKLSYDTAIPGGTGDFATGSQTVISTPAIEYPHGYSVSVTGGHVVSAPNAAELLIAADAGAGTVTVTVRPS